MSIIISTTQLPWNFFVVAKVTENLDFGTIGENKTTNTGEQRHQQPRSLAFFPCMMMTMA